MMSGKKSNFAALTPESLPHDSHIIEVTSESFGFAVVHKRRGKILYTASYDKGDEAMRVASSIGSRYEKNGDKVFLLVNPRAN